MSFDRLKTEDRKLAYMICNNYERLKVHLESALRTFLLESFKSQSPDTIKKRFASEDKMKQFIQVQTKLTVMQMPSSICSLRQHFINNPAGRIAHLFQNQAYSKDVPTAVKESRILLHKLTQHTIAEHKRGYCWDGQLSLDDWEVIDVTHIYPIAKSVRCTSRAMSNMDLTQIADTVVPNFMINGVIPVFMEHFTNALKSHGTLAEEDFRSWYYAYLLLHPFVMSSIGRANLLRNLYWLLVDLNFEENPFFDTVFKVAPSSDWRDFIMQTPVNYIIWKVFWYKLIPNFNTLPYFNLLGSIIKYHRHLVHHGPDHARDGKVTTMSSTDDSELLAAAHDQDCLAECIKNLLQQKKVTSDVSVVLDAYAVTWEL